MSNRADIDDFDAELAGIDDGGTNKPNVWFWEGRNSWVYRASSINNCSKQLILFRQGFEGAPPPKDMLARFRDGHLHEGSVLAGIQQQREGWRVTQSDGTDEYTAEIVVREPTPDKPGIIILGHIDGLAINNLFSPNARIAEAKAFSKDNYDKAVKAVERGTFWDEYPYYKDQMTIYMSAMELGCIFGIKNKNDGKVFVFDVDEPPGDINEILDRIKLIDMQANVGVVPDACDRRSFPCPMFRFHDDDGDDELSPDDIMASALGQSANPSASTEELEVLCREYEISRDAEKEAGSRKKEIQRKIAELMGDPEDDVKVDLPGYRLGWKPHTYRFLDEEEMRGDGIDPDIYRRERKSFYPNVQAKKKKTKKAGK
jgi:hypothetical protein